MKMGLGKVLLFGTIVAAVGAAGLFAFLQFKESRDRAAACEAKIEDGFRLVNEGGEENLDQAIRLAKDAKELNPEDRLHYLLLVRAYLDKKMYKKASDQLDEAIAGPADARLIPEWTYYVGKTCSYLYKDLRSKELWDKAFAGFTEAAASPYHRADAYFGIGALYFSLYQENPSPLLQEKVISNFQRCVELEAEKAGYDDREPDSRCPLCGLPFRKKMDNPEFASLMAALTGGK